MDFTISTTKTLALQIQQLIRQKRIELGYPTPSQYSQKIYVETLVYPCLHGIKRRKKSPSYDLVESIWSKNHNSNTFNKITS